MTIGKYALVQKSLHSFAVWLTENVDEQVSILETDDNKEFLERKAERLTEDAEYSLDNYQDEMNYDEDAGKYPDAEEFHDACGDR